MRFDPVAKTITFEARPLRRSERPYPGWPVVLDARARPLGPWRARPR